MKKLILASLLAAISASSLATDYYVVVPLPKRESAENITVALNTASLPGGMAGRPYAGFDFATALLVTGDPKFNGTGVKWSLSGGALPQGLVLSADGKLTGTPTTAGTSNFQLQALYKTKAGQQAYQVVVSDFTVVLASSAPPAALQGTAYAYDFKPRLSVSGDPQFTQAQVTWSGSGALPRGLELTRDGILSGVPTEPGTSNFNIVASYQGRSATQSYQLVVNALAPDFRVVGNITTAQNFGTVNAGSSSSPMTFPLVNSGTGAGSLTLPAFTGANPEDFSATTNCTNIVPNANCQVAVTFQPTLSGSRYASLLIAGTTYNFVGTAQTAATSYVVLKTGTSYQIPAGVAAVTAWAVGGGGGGAGSTNVDSTSGGGGGAGGLTWATFQTQAGQTISYTIGAGGTAGYNTGSGGSGGTTTVTYGGVTLQAAGGAGGRYNNANPAQGGSWSGGVDGVAGGLGLGVSGDLGGGGGGGIGYSSAVTNPSSMYAGSAGATAIYKGGLDAALAAAGQALGKAGVGGSSGSSSTGNTNHGTAGIGYGHGGGGAGYYGGNGAAGALGGGGGGAAGYSGYQYGGAGGAGFIVLKLN